MRVFVLCEMGCLLACCLLCGAACLAACYTQPACLLPASLWMTGKDTMKLSSTKCGNCRGGREEVVVVGGCERW